MGREVGAAEVGHPLNLKTKLPAGAQALCSLRMGADEMAQPTALNEDLPAGRPQPGLHSLQELAEGWDKACHLHALLQGAIAQPQCDKTCVTGVACSW